MKIASNLPSIIALNQMKLVNRDIHDNSLKLSSGDRIYHSKFDPSGLAVSEYQKSASRSMLKANKNASDAVSLFQIAEGTLSNIQEIGIRLKELAMQSSTDTLNNNDRKMIAKEFSMLRNEIKRLATKTEFNGQKLLDGSNNNLQFQIGIFNNSDNRLAINFRSLASKPKYLGISNLSIENKKNAHNALTPLTSMLDQLSSRRSIIGSVGQRLKSSISNLEISRQNSEDFNSQIRDADYAKETATRASLEIRNNASLATQKIANNFGESVLKLIS